MKKMLTTNFRSGKPKGQQQYKEMLKLISDEGNSN